MSYSISMWLTVILLSCFSWACSSGGSDSGSDAAGVDPNILISGFWDISTTDDSGQVKVAYVEIKPNGLVTEFNDDKNTSTGGLNCFNTEESQLTALGNNEYQQTDPIDGGVDLFTAIKDGNTLTVSYIDVEDENENGNRTEVITESHSAVVGVAVVDLTLCDTNNSQGGSGAISDGGEAIIGADGIAGHPSADLIGTWNYRGVSVNQVQVEVASYLELADGAIEARLQILTNSTYIYEELDFRGGQVWAEFGFIYFNEEQFDVNQQGNTDGPVTKMTVVSYQFVNGALVLTETINGDTVVFALLK